MTNPNVRPDLEALKVLLSKATPGTWRVGRQNGAPRDHLVDMGDPPAAPYFRMHQGLPETLTMLGSPAFGIVESDDAPAEEIAANAALIVAMRNSIPDLIAHIERLEEVVAGFVGALTDYGRNRDNVLSIDHDGLCARIKQARTILSQGKTHE